MSEVRRWMCWNVWGYWQPPRNTRRRIRGASFVDRDGNELFRDTESTPTGGPVNSPDAT